MADKHEFETDNDAGAPTTGLSSSSVAGAQSAAAEPDYPMTARAAGRSRLWLLLPLVIIAAGGGYWYLMTDQPVAPPTTVPPVVVVVPPPVQPAAAPPASMPASPAAPAVVKTPPTVPVASKPAPPPVADGAWRIGAGTYQNAAAAEAVAAKIRQLGYQPQIRSEQQTKTMTRLRLGTFPASELAEELAYVRGLVPEAFALRSGANFTVYAGTYANPRNVREKSELLASEGVRVEEEPLAVKRTVSIVEFGGFSERSAAVEAAARARQAGIAAEVIPPR